MTAETPAIPGLLLAGALLGALGSYIGVRRFVRI